MAQRNEVLTREDNRIPFIPKRRTAMQEDYPTVAESAIPANRIEQGWISEVSERAPVSGTTPRLANTLVKIVRWLNRLGSGEIDDGYLEARHAMRHSSRINDIRL